MIKQVSPQFERQGFVYSIDSIDNWSFPFLPIWRMMGDRIIQREILYIKRCHVSSLYRYGVTIYLYQRWNPLSSYTSSDLRKRNQNCKKNSFGTFQIQALSSLIPPFVILQIGRKALMGWELSRRLSESLTMERDTVTLSDLREKEKELKTQPIKYQCWNVTPFISL